MDEWQRIETAPTDGTEILAAYYYDYGFQGKPNVYGPWMVAFRGGKWMASWDDSWVIESEGHWGVHYLESPLEPTHWMPKPKLPEKP